MYLKAITSIEFQLLRNDFVETKSIDHTYITWQRLKNIGEFFFKTYNKTICTTYVQLGRKNHRHNRSAKSREITRKAEQETTRRQLSSGF